MPSAAKLAYERYERNQIKKQKFLKEYHQPQGLHDTERKKCYRAEWDYELKSGGLAWVDRNELWGIMSESELKAFADRVTQSKTFEKIRVGRSYGTVRVQMMQNRSGGIGGKATYNKIWIKPRSATKYLVLHELVHAAGYMNHGVGFREALLKLVSRFMGPSEAKLLKSCFKEKKLKTTMPTIRVKSYDEWLVGYERMKAAREKIKN
jgi:hypothetical protein